MMKQCYKLQDTVTNLGSDIITDIAPNVFFRIINSDMQILYLSHFIITTYPKRFQEYCALLNF